MDPKILLMPVYTRGNEIERLRGALSLATCFGAHLDVLHARTKPSDLLDNELFALSPGIRDRIVSIMDEETQVANSDLRAHFETLCAEYKVRLGDRAGDGPTAAWREIQGARSELVALQGRVSDLVIIPRPKSGIATTTFEEAILHTGRPVLLVPRGLWEISFTKVVIGWNGGLEAARAVQQALPFLTRAEEVTIAAKPGARPGAEELVRYLSHHGVSAEIRVLGETSAGPALLAMAAELGADFLVTGGYSHTRLRQSILGGVTSHMLGHAEIPVLMAH